MPETQPHTGQLPSRETFSQEFQDSKLIMATLLASSALTVMAGATIAPALPSLTEQFSETADASFLARLALTLPALFITLFSPIAGFASDRIGAKRVLLVSVCGYCVAGTCGAFVASLPQLLVTRAFLGLAVGGVMTGATTLIGHLYHGEQRLKILGFQGASMSFGGVVFLSLGGYMASLSWRYPFFLYLIPVFLVPLVLLQLPDLRQSLQTAKLANEADAKEFSLLRLLPVYFFAFLAMGSFYVIPTQLPFRLAEAGLGSAIAAGIALATNTVAGTLAAFTFRWLRSRVSEAVIMFLMFFGLGLGILLAGLFSQYNSICLALVVSGLGFGLAMPLFSSLTLAMSPEGRRGQATGGLSASIFLGQFLSPILFKWCVQGTDIPSKFQFAGVSVIAVAFVSATVVWKMRKAD